MTRSTLRLLVMAVALFGATSAQAGHYRLPVDNFITQVETDQLAKAGINTTLGLLNEVKTAAQRKKVASVTGIALARVDELACQADLLRIDGIGPTMVRLLNASGVKHSKALGAEAAAALLERMKAVNLAQKIANVLPREGQVAAWVAAAGRLGPGIEGVP